MNILTPVSESVSRWTQSSKECYLRGCRCEGCYYNKFFTDPKQVCRMKSSVLVLVRKYGISSSLERKEIIKD